MSSHAATTWPGIPRSRVVQVAGEIALTVAGVLTYFGIRHLSHSDPGAAMRNARYIMTAERRLGLHHETWLQGRILPYPPLVTFFDDVYIYGHWPVIAVALGWLLLRHPAEFRVARTAMMASGAVALGVFAFFPVAPPRLADPSIVDTVTLYSNAYRVLQPPALTDVYAAMPSLHCGWDLIVALCVARVATRRSTRTAMYLLPATMVAAVIVTGNHYILDAVAGDLLALSGLAFARRLEHRHEPTASDLSGRERFDAIPRASRTSRSAPATRVFR